MYSHHSGLTKVVEPEGEIKAPQHCHNGYGSSTKCKQKETVHRANYYKHKASTTHYNEKLWSDSLLHVEGLPYDLFMLSLLRDFALVKV